MNSTIFGTPSLKIWLFVVQMTMPYARNFWENLISPFREPLMLDMLLRKLVNMPARSSNFNPPSTPTKLINFVNFLTKLPMKNQEIIKKCKFRNGSHPRGKCPAYGKSCLNCNWKKPFQSLLCPKSKKGTQNRANWNWLRGVYWPWIFCTDY